MKQGHILKISRLEGLTDGIFAIVMTILILDLHIPSHIQILNLPQYLIATIPIKLAVYIGSFVILGTLWIAMNFQTGLLERLNRTYLWTHVIYLMVICLVPFSASLVGSYSYNYASIYFFAVNLLLASLCQLLIIQCAHHYQLNNVLYSNQIRSAAIRRIFVAPPFYVAAIFIAPWSTSIAFILLVAPTVVYTIPGRIDRFNN